jgi:hypothetical protein
MTNLECGDSSPLSHFRVTVCGLSQTDAAHETRVLARRSFPNRLTRGKTPFGQSHRGLTGRGKAKRPVPASKWESGNELPHSKGRCVE